MMAQRGQTKGEARQRPSLEEIEAAEAQIVEETRKIGYNTVEYTIEYLADKLRSDDFYIPEYQREDVWEEDRKHRFIESLLMGLPIPFLFFWENIDDGRLEIVDGSQRIRTIREFLDGNLRLGDLETLNRISGFDFNDLKESRQRKLKNRTIRGVVLDEEADDQARAELFDRINTGSKSANPAEIRRGALPGPFTELITELADSPTFKILTPMSQMQENSRTREELVSRFFALSGDLDGYRDRVADYLFEYAKRMRDELVENPEIADAMRGEFHRTMDFINHSTPYGFRKNDRATATPKTRYEAIAIGTKQALERMPDLQVEEEKFKELIESDRFGAIVRSDGANARARLTQRIGYIRDGLLESVS
ncbi:hypothetical protein CBI38_35365 (plasmid) [Rhodococcus oxybenzonivorans]|uniref:GmrSD restriction endonucleases N-terminal domain-containing protein n=1 Tax=Rhodococcus oxybenzonivorans TaxID=1990687 RepID=A0A2S2C773_9NOCA|nr:DUF262 domain-containing protein [Rhodococcus oxybenzonivorans]AWK76726.1 hypothetical protein CBI38_35365 [Rhodococcus oxybenzonivorans]